MSKFEDFADVVDGIYHLGVLVIMIVAPVFFVWSKSPTLGKVMLGLLVSIIVVSLIATFKLFRYRVSSSRALQIGGLANTTTITFAAQVRYNKTASETLRAIINHAECVNILRSDTGKWRYFDVLSQQSFLVSNRYGDCVSVVEYTLQRELPNMFFASRSHDSRFLSLFRDVQRNSLDASFDDYYQTFFPINYHVDSRAIITPEVMLAMTYLQGVDIEIVRNKLYFYSNLLDSAMIPAYVNACSTVHASLDDHTAGYRDDRLPSLERSQQGIAKWGSTLRKNRRHLSLNAHIFVLSGALYTGITAILAIIDGFNGNEDIWDLVMISSIAAAVLTGLYIQELYTSISSKIAMKAKEDTLRQQVPR